MVLFFAPEALVEARERLVRECEAAGAWMAEEVERECSEVRRVCERLAQALRG